MKVRIAQVDDLSGLLTLRCAMWPHIQLHEHEQRLQRRMNGGSRFETFVLEAADGQMCGFAEVTSDTSASGAAVNVLLQVLFVTPGMRRRGGANALLESVNRWAHSRGAVDLSSQLPLDDEHVRAASRWLGFAEGEEWVATSRQVNVPLEISPQPAQDLSATPQVAFEPQLSVEKVRSPLSLIINGILILIALVCLANTDIYSRDVWRGVLLPLLDGIFVVYFLFLFMAMRFRKRTDSSARADQLFRIDD